MTIGLFFVVALVWGLTWFAIHCQIGGTALDVAIFWRFALAALLLGMGMAVSGRLHRPPARAVPWYAAMGACMFSCNFFLIYGSEIYLPSGITSVIFSLVSIFNVLNQWLFFRQRPDNHVLVGSLIGVAGVALLLRGNTGAGTGAALWLGSGLALGGTLLFSLGNMASRRMEPLSPSLLDTVFYGMCIGATLSGAIAVIHGDSLMPAISTRWIAGLFYLSIFGSLAGFLAYLALPRRIGAAKVACTPILSPVVAIIVSTALEGIVWSGSMIAGLALILASNVLAFVRPPFRSE